MIGSVTETSIINETLFASSDDKRHSLSRFSYKFHCDLVRAQVPDVKNFIWNAFTSKTCAFNKMSSNNDNVCVSLTFQVSQIKMQKTISWTISQFTVQDAFVCIYLMKAIDGRSSVANICTLHYNNWLLCDV